MNWRIDDMKKALCTVGVGLIISGTVMAIYLLNSKKKEYNERPESIEPEKKQFRMEDMFLKMAVSTQEEPIYEDVKSSAIGSIYSRHEDAATIIRDSVETIRENVKVSTSVNNEIDELSAELDKMLSED